MSQLWKVQTPRISVVGYDDSCGSKESFETAVEFKLGNLKPGDRTPDDPSNERLPSLGKTETNCKQDGSFKGENGMVDAYMNYYDVEVGMIGVNSVVMKSDEDEKSWAIDMETNKDG
jgi:hypothetical protein